MTLGLINANPVVHAKKERIARSEDFHGDDAVDPLEIYDILFSIDLVIHDPILTSPFIFFEVQFSPWFSCSILIRKFIRFRFVCMFWRTLLFFRIFWRFLCHWTGNFFLDDSVEIDFSRIFWNLIVDSQFANILSLTLISTHFVRDIRDPEHPYSLEQLSVLSEESITVDEKLGRIL